jgi:monoamine oxidase
MPRSALTSVLVRALRTIRGARAAGIPPHEYYEMEVEAARRRALSRRGLLAGAASVGVIAACDSAGTVVPGADGGDASAVEGGPPDGGGPEGGGLDSCLDAPETVQEVGIVGAGMAGVHCAYLLKQAGVRAVVYDAQNRIGGRMFTDRTTFAQPDGQHCELGGELIDTAHTTIQSLCQLLGIDLYDYTTDAPGLNHIVARIGGQTLTISDILAGFGPIATAINNAVNTLTNSNNAPSYKDHNGGDAIDAMSIHQWFDSVGASGPVRTLLEVAYNIEFGLETSQQSAWNFLWQISPADPANFQIFGASDERFHTKTGNDAIPNKLAALLDASQIQLGHQLVAVSVRPDGRIVLTFGKGSGTTTAVFDHVVLALPFSILRSVDLSGVTMPAVKTKAIQTLGYGTNAKLMVGFASRVWRTPPTAADGGTSYPASDGSAYSDLAHFQNTWETSRLQPGTSGILTDYTGGNLGVAIGSGTPESQRDAFLTDFEVLFPGATAASNGKVSRMHWPTFPWTKGSYASYLVGQWTGISGAEIERVGNIHFAGEHTSTAFQGFMEGAAETGAMAAAEILADLGLMQDAGADGGIDSGWDAPALDGALGMTTRIRSPIVRGILSRAHVSRVHGGSSRALAMMTQRARRRVA